MFKKRTIRHLGAATRPKEPSEDAAGPEVPGTTSDAGARAGVLEDQPAKRRNVEFIGTAARGVRNTGPSNVVKSGAPTADAREAGSLPQGGQESRSEGLGVGELSEAPLEPRKPKTRFGPQAASNIRATTVTDFQPDVCKDYKQTGYCGYGDNCKFLHMRENYAASWQLDLEWVKSAGSKNKDANTETNADSADARCDATCGMCGKPHQAPVKTKCGHIFCEACFLEKSKQSSACAVCNKDTGSARPVKSVG